MKGGNELDKAARTGDPAKRIKARLDAAQSIRVKGSKPVTGHEPPGHVAHQHSSVTTRG